MYRIAVVEDESKFTEQAKEYLARFFRELGETYQVTCYSNGLAFIDGYSAAFHIVLLDIDMPLMDGIQIAEKLRKIDPEVILLYLTTMAQYAVFGYDVDAIGFLVKPYNYFNFALKMKKAVGILKQRKNLSIVITDNRAKRVLVSDDILYANAAEHKVVFHTNTGEYRCWGSLKDYAKKLEEAHFVFTSRDYLVNLKYAVEVLEREVRIGNELVPLSRDKKKQFMIELTRYFGGL